MILFEGVSKRFILRHERARSFQEAFVSLWNRRNRSREVFWALRDISFKVEDGGSLGVIGENGSGKSTALKLITRIFEPTSGMVRVHGKVAALLELGAGFHPDLTGRENIFLNASILGMTKKQMLARFEDIVEFSELERFIDTPIKHYSSGMCARLGFAVAIAVDPDLLVIDEVLAVGDEAFQRKCLDKIRDFKEAGKTLVLVSHNLQMVADLCTQAVWLEGGVERAMGPSNEVVDQYLEWANRKNKVRLEAVHRPQASSEGETRRWGTREAEIIQVELLDANGQPTSVFDTGDTMVARLHYQAHQPVERPVFGVAIHRADNLQINDPNTKASGYNIEHIEGCGAVDFVVDSLPLLEGQYLFSAAIYDNSCIHPYDHHDRLYSFSIQPRTTGQRSGIFQMPARWKHIDGVGGGRGEPGLPLP
ncbi:MAG TPA: ABC transporter ATP-binding protein [Dehalococcoidia bacterium]|nr:ABC transporter ATP-binding protein [Dehalococcoidia bacterium]